VLSSSGVYFEQRSISMSSVKVGCRSCRLPAAVCYFTKVATCYLIWGVRINCRNLKLDMNPLHCTRLCDASTEMGHGGRSSRLRSVEMEMALTMTFPPFHRAARIRARSI
jgi:hypothetical protein